MDQGDTFSIPGGVIEVTSIDLAANPAVAQISVTREVPSGKLDVFFLVDNSGSFEDDIGDLRDQLPGIINDIKSQAADAHFGLATFVDYPIPGYGFEDDYPYQLHVPIPGDGDASDGSQAVIDIVENLLPFGGDDAPESQLTALYQAATGEGAPNYDECVNDCSIPAGQGANFRNDAAKIILLGPRNNSDEEDEENEPSPNVSGLNTSAVNTSAIRSTAGLPPSVIAPP